MSRLPEFAGTFNSTHLFPEVERIGEDVRLPVEEPFAVAGLAEDMSDAACKLYLDRKLHEDLGLDDRMLRSASFTEVTPWETGRQDSSMQNFFGVLHLVIDEGAKGVESDIPVAVKPYIPEQNEQGLGYEDAIHEYVGCKVLQDYGLIKPLKPVGFWIDEDHRTYYMTLFEGDVRSLDNVSWFDAGEDKVSAHPKLEKALTMSAHTLGLLHIQGFIHGDAQIKNMAYDSYGLRLVDLTSLRRILPDELTTIDNITRRIRNDLLFLVISVMAASQIQPLIYMPCR